MKKVSVIMPNYCHAPYLRERMDSILAQDYTNMEIILLDDASTDDSISILQSYTSNPSVKHFVVNDANSGNTFLQWEKGLSLATGDYVWIAESDDMSDVHFLSRMVRVLEDTGSVLAFSRSKWIDESGREIKRSADRRWATDFTMEGKPFVVNYLLGYNHICNASAVVFCRDAYASVDMERVQRYNASGDRLFWIYIALQGKVSYIAEPLNRFRQHANKVSGAAQHGGLNIEQDHSVYATVSSGLSLTVWDRCRVCGYHWHAMHQPSVSKEGKERAMYIWRQEFHFGRWSWIIYMLHQLKEKCICIK